MPRKSERKDTEVKKIKVCERNAKFMDFYHDIKLSEEFLAVKGHKRVKYLSEHFVNKTQLHMPVGTIYKLLRAEHSETPVTTETEHVTVVSANLVSSHANPSDLPNESGKSAE